MSIIMFPPLITCPVISFLWNRQIVTTHLMKKLVDIFIKSCLHEGNGDRVEDSLGAEVGGCVVKAE